MQIKIFKINILRLIYTFRKTKRLCEFCCKKKQNYTCAKCNKMYCSSLCFQSREHVQCNEIFYKDCMIDSFNNSKDMNMDIFLDMMEMFKPDTQPKINPDKNKEKQDISIDLNTIDDRMENVDLDNPGAIWDALTPYERNEFDTLLKTKKGLGKILPIWQPWWSAEALIEIPNEILPFKMKTIQNVTFKKNSTEKQDKDKISNQILYSILSCAFIYTGLMKLYNGDLKFIDKSELLDIFDKLMPKNSKGSQIILFTSVNHWCEIVLSIYNTFISQDLLIKQESNCIKNKISQLYDVICILQYKCKCESCKTVKSEKYKSETFGSNDNENNLIFHGIHHVLSDFESILKIKNRKKRNINEKDAKNIFSMNKKVQFFRAWVLDQEKIYIENASILNRINSSPFQLSLESIQLYIQKLENELFLDKQVVITKKKIIELD
ncbi:hypothetical protein A3Q56_07986 [Intoshia linei]|uniref:HIT-type domain-containing protein n=1 Tax=Intoshia linei TaxID=1819745 RepID=A0A177AQP5_9BILA|nr:hypothetical protein A3Q56_07986 [Intoshia linei]